ncbi:MAG: hypothetical protein M1832_000649 [Thelocarpon impressellum]|nr:MAG: hypothetical protein M1832_000649 [Thelocarpon impressellum]
MDALDIVEWGFNACAKGSEDEETFLWLGNRILEEVGGEMQVEEDAARARGPWTAEIVEELDKTGVREAMRTRLAVLKLDRSSWDERQTATPLDRINEYMASITNNCEMRVVRPEGGSSEYALFATRDIFPGEIVLQEEPAMAVTIKLHSGPAENCENCATRLVTSEKQDVPVLNDNEPLPTEPALTQETAGAATERRIESSPATGDGELNAGIWDGAHGDGDAMDIDGDDRVDDNAVSNGARIADGVMAIDAHTDAMKSPDGQVDEPPDDFLGPRLCPDCRTAAFCSRLCHEVGHHLYHRVLCDKDLVEWVADLIPDWPGTSARHGLYTSTPARSRLYCVMLARALVMGSTYEIDAVEMAGILFGDSRVRFQDPAAGSEVPCGLTTGHSSSIHHAGNANSIDWSFLTHVSVPLRILDLIGMDGAASVEYCDGWMINNLLDKMAQFASVTSASRQINFYNLEGKLTDVCVAKDLLDEYDDGRVLIGTVHPAIGLVQQVTKAEGGNVRRIDGTDAKLQALQTTKNDTDGRAGLDDADAEVAPAIRAGDRILIVGNDGDMRVNEDGLGQAGLGNPELDSKTVTPDTSSPASDRKLDIHVGC